MPACRTDQRDAPKDAHSELKRWLAGDHTPNNDVRPSTLKPRRKMTSLPRRRESSERGSARSAPPPWIAACAGMTGGKHTETPNEPSTPADLARRLLRPARMADRPRQAGRPLPAAHAPEGAVAHPGGRAARRGVGRCDDLSRSTNRSAPGSTSSPTARCGARATPTASPRRSTGSTWTTTAPRSTVRASRCRCRA